MPRGSGHPDLSQRPRREAPGMLTAIAILERELGMIEHSRHRLQRRLKHRLGKDEGEELRRQLLDLDKRRAATLDLLDEQHQEYEERLEHSAEGINARASRPPTPPRFRL